MFKEKIQLLKQFENNHIQSVYEDTSDDEVVDLMEDIMEYEDKRIDDYDHILIRYWLLKYS